jgi:hypothetical protein
MTTQFIEYQGKKYPIKEPTIKMWSEVMKLQGILDDQDMFIKVIELTTGLSEDEILAADAKEIRDAGRMVFGYLNQKDKRVVSEFTHNGKEYQFLDVAEVSFGQFVDIDTFLTKEETYRIQNLNELAAYLYTEKGTKYGETKIKQRIKEFETLPIKYLEGSVFFLLNLAKASEGITTLYSQSKLLWLMMKVKIVFHLIGAGIQQSAHSVKTRFGSLTAFLTYPFISALIIFLTLKTLIPKGKDK